MKTIKFIQLNFSKHEVFRGRKCVRNCQGRCVCVYRIVYERKGKEIGRSVVEAEEMEEAEAERVAYYLSPKPFPIIFSEAFSP